MTDSGADLVIRPATVADAAAIAAIYNAGILDRIATFETELRSPEERAAWLTNRDRRYLVLVAEQGGAVIGWAGLSPYSSRPCYRGVAEHSIYLARETRGRGYGQRLLGALIDAAEREGFWKLTSRLFLFNESSRALHRRLGFRDVGINQKHARLDGHWLDTVTVERLIESNLT
ncbi:MAG: N-acetyltransferase [Chloroflexi bacterium]|nr:N-acetyltransferase [Chloroflexota bacterium]